MGTAIAETPLAKTPALSNLIIPSSNALLSWHRDIITTLVRNIASPGSMPQFAEDLSAGLQKTLETLAMDGASVLTLEENGFLVPFATATTPSLRNDWAARGRDCDHCFRGMAAYEGMPTAVEHMQRELWKRPCFVGGLDCCVCVPLRGVDSTIGVLHLVSHAPARFAFWENPCLSAIGMEIGALLLAVHRAQEAQQRISEAKAAQEQLSRSERMVTLGRMASGIAHDINNNLAAILVNTQLLARSTGDKEGRSTLQLIERAALDGALTVRRIQEFARASHEGDFVRVDLNQVMREVMALTKPRWHNEAQQLGKAVSLTMELPKLPPVAGHPSELRDAFTNIIINAIDAMPGGGTISIKSWLRDDWTYVSVTDTGQGMSEEVRRRIFEPFFSTKGARGTGLGMSLAYGIVTRHRGRIAVNSREGLGTEITVCFPVDRAASKPSRPGRLPKRVQRRSVLIVEDEVSIREALAEILRRADHDVTTASNGDEGLAALTEGSYDVVLTDLAMPGEVSGWDVAAAARERRSNSLVALMTGWGILIDQAKLRERGVDRVLPKPFGAKEILQLLADYKEEEGQKSKAASARARRPL